MSEVKKLLGRRIQELRKAKNIKQEKLAELIGIATRNLSNIETGRTFPSPETLEKISIELDVKIKDLFDFEHQKDNIDLYSEITNKIKPVNRDRLQDIYKIVLALTQN